MNPKPLNPPTSMARLGSRVAVFRVSGLGFRVQGLGFRVFELSRA